MKACYHKCLIGLMHSNFSWVNSTILKGGALRTWPLQWCMSKICQYKGQLWCWGFPAQLYHSWVPVKCHHGCLNWHDDGFGGMARGSQQMPWQRWRVTPTKNMAWSISTNWTENSSRPLSTAPSPIRLGESQDANYKLAQSPPFLEHPSPFPIIHSWPLIYKLQPRDCTTQ